MSSVDLDAFAGGVVMLQRCAKNLSDRVIQPAGMRSIHVKLQLSLVLRRLGTDIANYGFGDGGKRRILAAR